MSSVKLCQSAAQTTNTSTELSIYLFVEETEVGI